MHLEGSIPHVSKLIENTDSADAAAVAKMLRIAADPSSYIDKGGAGTVYRLPGGWCMKILENRRWGEAAAHMNRGNSVAKEAHFLELLSGFSSAGVRSPRYLAHVTGSNADEPDIILMEELPAVNLQRVMNGVDVLPRAFERGIFFDSLDRYIATLHSTFAIAHLDLEPRNIMIDRRTGLPYVIDFGRAQSIRGLSAQDRRRLENADEDAIDRAAAAWARAEKLSNLRLHA
jgi:tRNA A-37 threonylcarbamoyl transferase component Bud32